MQSSQMAAGSNGAIDVTPNAAGVEVNTSAEPMVFQSTVGRLETVEPSSTQTTRYPQLRTQFVPEPPLGQFFERFVELFNAVLPTTDIGLVKNVLDFYPVQSLLSGAPWSGKLAYYQAWRADIELQFQFKFSTGTYGGYCVTPLLTYPGTDLTVTNVLQVENCRQPDLAFEVDAQVGGVYSCVLPFTHWFDYAMKDADPYNTAWRVYITQLAGLQSAIPSGVPSGNVKVYARFVPGSWTLAVPALQGKEGVAPRPSQVLRAVGAAASAFTNLPGAGLAAELVGRAANFGADVAAYFGHSRGVEAPSALGMRPLALDNYAAAAATDHSLPLALVGDAQMAGDPAALGLAGDGHLELASVFARPTLVASYPLETSTASGSNIMIIPVTPFLLVNKSAAVKLPLAAGYVGTPFEYWRGDMVFRVRVFSSRLHRGALQAFWSPTQPGGSTGNVTTLLLNEVIDLADGVEHVFRVGHAVVAPWLRSQFVEFGVTPTVAIRETSYNGYFCLKLMIPFQAQAPGNYAYIRVFAEAGANMEFRLPRSVLRVIDGDNPTGHVCRPGYNMVVQGKDGGGGVGALGDEEITEACVCELVPGSGPVAADAVFFPGSGVRSLRAFLQKPTKYGMILEGVGGTVCCRYREQNGPIRNAGIPTPGSGHQHNFQWDVWAQLLYASFAGSRHFQVVANAPVAITVAQHDSLAEDYATETGWQAAFGTDQANSMTNSGGFVTGWNRPVKFAPSTGKFDASVFYYPSIFEGYTTTSVLARPLGQTPTATGFKANCYACYGSDVTVGPWRQVPVFVLLEGQGAPPSDFFYTVPPA